MMSMVFRLAVNFLEYMKPHFLNAMECAVTHVTLLRGNMVSACSRTDLQMVR